MKGAAPLVSVILPVFNRVGSIERAIESVLAQSYAPVDLVVVDDGSTDGTAEILERYGRRATILRQPNRGAYVARNMALRHVHSPLVAFIDSDDAWLPDKLARQVPLMRDGIGLVYGDVAIVAEAHADAPLSGRTSFSWGTPRRGQVLEALALGNFIPTSTVLVRVSALKEIGGFPETSRVSADYLTWFRLARRHAFDFVPEPVAHYTIHPAGISYDLGNALAARIRLFREERARTDDPATLRVLDHLLFNLGIHLALAVVRRRAGTVEKPLSLARQAISQLDGWRALWCSIVFVANQAKLRAQRFLS